MTKLCIKYKEAKISMSAAALLVGVVQSTISKWYNYEGLDSVTKLKDRKVGVFPPPESNRKITKEFTRRFHCRRGKYECASYGYCQGYRLKYNIHPERFRADSSCYKESRVKFYHRGDRTANVDTTVKRS